MTAPKGSAARHGLQRVAVVIGCLGFAVFAVGNGLDRESQVKPAMADRVPGFFAARMLSVRAQHEIDAGNYQAAKRWAEHAVRIDPIDPESSALLGAARYALGDAAGADRAFRVAGNFGWRTASTQFYWMNMALDAGDYRVAAERLDALLRQEPDLVGEQSLLEPIEKDPRGRAAMVDRLVERPDWLTTYADDVSNLSPDVALQRAQVLNGLARRGHGLGCSGIGPLTRTLIANDRVRDAFDIWRAHCPVERGALIADASFANLDVHQADSPFAWTVVGDSDTSVNLESDETGPGHHIAIASSSSFPRKVLMQLVMAPAGTYRVSWRALAQDGTPSRRVAVTFGCAADSRDWLPATLDSASGRWSATAQATGSCAGSWLSFTLQPGNDSVNLDQISLQPVR